MLKIKEANVMFIIWYKTRSKKYTREIKFSSYEKAKALYDALDRDFKYLIAVSADGIHHTLS